jgi:hypothetical protein
MSAISMVSVSHSSLWLLFSLDRASDWKSDNP